MNNFKKQHIKDLIHAYELGMLSDEQRQELELYLLDHEELLKDAKDFREIISLIDQDSDVRDTIVQLADQPPSTAEVSSGKRFRRWLTPALITLVFVLLLILQPWQMAIRPVSEVAASENSLAVISFVNLANPEDPNNYEQLFTNLLITDLAESQYLHVITRERILDLLNMQDEDNRNVNDHNTALRLAKAAKAKWLLKGTIIQEEPVIILTTQLIDAENGSVFATGRVEGEQGLSIFELTDRLTVKIKASLSLPRQALTEEDPPVTYITTTSVNAYKHYLEGVDNFHKFYWEDATEAFKKSLEYDSTMAMSYYYLSVLVDSSYIAKAVKYSDKAPRLNRKYILAAEAMVNRNIDSAITIWKDIASNLPDQKHANYLVGLYQYEQGNYEESLEYLKRALEIDPNFKLPYNYITYTYLKLGNPEDAIEAANRYESLAPDEAGPYVCQGDVYIETGRIDDAIKAFGKALAINPKFSYTALKLGKAYFWKGQLDSALTLFHKSYHDYKYFVRSEARLSLACVESIKGNFLKSMQMLDEYIAADIVDKHRERYPLFRLYKAILYGLMNREDSALIEINKCLSIYQKADFAYWAHSHFLYYYNVQSYNIQLIAFSGLSDSAKMLADQLAADLNENRLPLMPHYQATGVIALADSQYEEAVEFLIKAIHPSNPLNILSRYLLGETYLESGDFIKARDSYRDLTTNYYHDCTLWSTFQVLAHFKLGLAYYQLGEFNDSRTEMKKFIDIWGKADVAIDEIEDARAILAQLERS